MSKTRKRAKLARDYEDEQDEQRAASRNKKQERRLERALKTKDISEFVDEEIEDGDYHQYIWGDPPERED